MQTSTIKAGEAAAQKADVAARLRAGKEKRAVLGRAARSIVCI
jgi:hypothetical protein